MRGRTTRWALASAVAIGLLVGATPAATAADAPVDRGGRRVTGTFAGDGDFVNEPCAVPDVPDHAGIGVAFTVTGQFSALGEAEVDGIVCLHPTDGTAFGPLTLSSRRGTITGDLDGAPTGGSAFDPVTFDLDYTVTGGTGAFRHARGTLAVDVTIDIGSYPIAVDGSVDGTLSRPAARA